MDHIWCLVLYCFRKNGAASASGGVVDDFEGRAIYFLQVGDDIEKVFCLRVSGGAEHAHERFGGVVETGSELDEADGAVDVFAEKRFSGVRVAGNHRADSFAKK
uniref:Uncharacterized protein n=1 Tax=mine drainage metagenome TaxID=410659 RepID=E6QL84_9ZZZZ